MTSDDRIEGKGRRASNGLILVCCAAFVCTMVGAAFAAVPLYRIFCQVTGFAGTTQRAEAASDVVLDKTIEVRFDANVANGLPWSFKPEQRSVTVKIGETDTIFYKVKNLADHTVTASAVFNVTPDQTGAYFSKIACFCFTEQTLEAGEEREMGVTFYVDPDIVNDTDAKYVSAITLSYTFYEAKDDTATPVAAVPSPSDGKTGQL
ncbi:cytochrome c oxidase assembly protein [Hartmannibacter diazotrophicus]|nr:cytochrome c oxidase assembly protein [Hartmannibacter diazotrophicus]